jgi:hypothetical protein
VHMKPHRPHRPLWAALGMALVAHAGLVAAWVHVEGLSPGKLAQAQTQTPSPRTLFWRWRQTSALARPSAPRVNATQPVSTPVDPAQAKPTAEPDAPAEAVASVRTADTGAQPAHFWPSSDLDIRALPLQAPDTTLLNDIAWTAQRPMRLRLSITAQGQVVDVAPLDAEPPPADLLAALAAMFKATPFMPARRQGQDVASLQNIEVGP